MKSINWTLFTALAIFAMSFPNDADAQNDENAIKERMLNRLESVDALKIGGTVGENNKGFLEQRAALDPQKTKTMNEENADRRALYTILSKRLGLSVTVVGQGRAESIRNKSAPKVWLQDPGGKWYQK
jgi:uncharacterized protein YdbL (DUF1318 family)